MEEIIIKRCTNQELSQSERLKLEAWLNESLKNRQIYAQLELILLDPGPEKREEAKKEVWITLKKKLGTQATSTPAKKQLVSLWYKVAAVLLVCFTVALTLHRANLVQTGAQSNIIEVRVIEKVSLPGQKIRTTLPDGTEVVLNAESKLIVPEKFTKEIREVALQGEAFFDVARDEQRPFVIKTGDIQVQVLGTSFNVRSYPDEAVATVAVATGKVAVSGKDKNEHLTPGEKAVYFSNSGSLIRGTFSSEEEYGWKDNILLIQGETMIQIMETLKRWYGVEFVIENKGIELNEKFSGKYQDPSLKAVLEGLSFVYNFSYKIEGKTVIIK